MILISMKRAALLTTIAALASLVLVFFLLGLASFNNESSITNNREQSANNPVQQVAAGIVRFENATNLTNNPDDSVYGQVAAAGSNVYVVWQESANGRNYDIFFKRSQDQASTFENGSITNLSKNSGFSEHPQLAVSENSVYVVWADNTSGNKEVLFAKSADSGSSFDKAKDLSDSSSDSYNQEIAAFESSVYVVWQEQDDEGNNAIVFRASKDGGNTFEDPVIISESNSNVDPRSFPKVAAYGNAVYVVWSVTGDADRKPGLFYVKSSDHGDTFSPITRLNGSEDVGEAQVGAYQDDVYVIWGGQDTAAVDRLLYVKSSDGGKTFTGPASVEGTALVNPLNVELAVMPANNGTDQSYFYIASQVALSSGNDEILLVSSRDGGHTFAKAINLSNNTGISECPSITVSGNDIFVIWEDLTAGNHEIFLSKGSMAHG